MLLNFFKLFLHLFDVALLIDRILDGDWEDSSCASDLFLQSLKKSARLSFLTVPSVEELSSCRVCKVRGYDAGFALTEDKEIICVHNNSGVRGAGVHLVRKAVQLGGRKVFHFDGWLSGFYSSLGFEENVTLREAWNDVYAPKDWVYDPIDIFDSAVSVYACELNGADVLERRLQMAVQRYSAGKPDVITRFYDA